MEQNVLHVENVTMQFGGVVAVNNLSMDIYEHEIVALIGPNGAGKTTAFNCITGVYEPTNGKVEFYGEPIVESYPRGKMKKIYAGENADRYHQRIVSTPDAITKRGIARTFQNIRLFKSMTVFENVLTAMHIRRTSNVFSATFRLNAKEERAQRERALELLEIFWGVQLGKADVRGFDLPADGLGGHRLLLAFELGKLRAERIGERLFAGLERADVVQTDVQAPQEPDAQQRLHVLLGIVAVAVRQTLRGQKPLALIKADVRAFHLAVRFDLPDRHGRTSFAGIHPKHTV